MKVAIVGMGTIGSGVLNTIQTNQDLIADYLGEALEVTHIYSRTVRNYHDNDLSGIQRVEDIDHLKKIDVDVVVEVMGGMDETYELLKHFLSRGIHVVSANKDMLAHYVDDLSAIANQNQAQLAYEASSAGGIPIINAIQYQLNANRIQHMMGILNGTSNYILTKMTSEGWSYDKALKEAQDIGFAEADPTNDVKGYDAQRKICLLSRLAYKRKIELDQVAVQGIDHVSIDDIRIARQNGYTLKLLAQSSFAEGQLSIEVAPNLIASNHQLAQVDDGMNAVFVEGNVIGQTMFYGPGAGSMETASAVVSDMMNIGRFGFVGNFETEKQAELKVEKDSQDLYVRFASNAQELLADAGIDFKPLESEANWPAILSGVSSSQWQAMESQADIKAVYPIQLTQD